MADATRRIASHQRHSFVLVNGPVDEVLPQGAHKGHKNDREEQPDFPNRRPFLWPACLLWPIVFVFQSSARQFPVG